MDESLERLTPNMTQEDRLLLDEILWLYTMGMHETIALMHDEDVKNIWYTIKLGFFVSQYR